MEALHPDKRSLFVLSFFPLIIGKSDDLYCMGTLNSLCWCTIQGQINNYLYFMNGKVGAT